MGENMDSITIGIPVYKEEEKNVLRILDVFTKIPKSIIKDIIVLSAPPSDMNEAFFMKSMINDPRIKIISEKRREGKAKALEKIIRHANGESILFCDADILFDENSVLKILTTLKNNDGVVVATGRWCSIKKSNGFFDSLSEYICNTTHKLNMFLSNQSLPCKVHGSFFAIKKRMAKHIPKAIISDDEYFSYIGQKIGRILYIPTASYQQKLPDNLRDYFKLRLRIITGHLYLKLNYSHSPPTINPLYLGHIMMRHLLSSKKFLKNFLLTAFLVMSNLILIPFAMANILRNQLPYRYHIASTKDI